MISKSGYNEWNLPLPWITRFSEPLRWATHLTTAGMIPPSLPCPTLPFHTRHSYELAFNKVRVNNSAGNAGGNDDTNPVNNG